MEAPFEATDDSRSLFSTAGTSNGMDSIEENRPQEVDMILDMVNYLSHLLYHSLFTLVEYSEFCHPNPIKY